MSSVCPVDNRGLVAKQRRLVTRLLQNTRRHFQALAQEYGGATKVLRVAERGVNLQLNGLRREHGCTFGLRSAHEYVPDVLATHHAAVWDVVAGARMVAGHLVNVKAVGVMREWMTRRGWKAQFAAVLLSITFLLMYPALASYLKDYVLEYVFLSSDPILHYAQSMLPGGAEAFVQEQDLFDIYVSMIEQGHLHLFYTATTLVWEFAKTLIGVARGAGVSPVKIQAAEKGLVHMQQVAEKAAMVVSVKLGPQAAVVVKKAAGGKQKKKKRAPKIRL